MKKLLILSSAIVLLGFGAFFAWAGIAGINSKWSSGDLVFEDAGTKADIFTIKDGTDGIRVDSGLTDIGGGTYSHADGDNDIGIAGDMEVLTTLYAPTSAAYFGSRKFVMTQYSADPNATSATCAVSGLDSDDYVIAIQNTHSTTGYVTECVPGSGVVTLYWSADPTTSVKVTILSYQD